MKPYYRTLLILALIIGTTSIAYAKGLVPCGGPAPEVMCRACDFIAMAQEIMKWFVGVSASIVALMFAFGGMKMVMSAGNTGAVKEGKEMMTNSVIGFLILLGAWLIVNTVLMTVMSDGGGIEVWGKIDCVANPTMTSSSVTNPTTGTVTNPTPTTTPAGTCSITPLAPITDPLALLMEGGQTVIWDNTDPQLKICAAKMGGTVTSAYRPPAYQTHLKSVHVKWCDEGLATNTDPACAEIKSAVSAEMSKHGLSCTRPVATNSNHSTGIAVDISGAPQVSKNCLTWYGPADPVHYTLQSGCTCG